MKKNILFWFFSFLIFGILGLAITGCSGNNSSSSSNVSGSKKVKYYTCSMHPWLHEDKPGTCPACGMKLTPIYEEEH